MACSSHRLYAGEVPILKYSVSETNQVQLVVATDTNHYYLLKVINLANERMSHFTKMVMGTEGKALITEPLSALPKSSYKVYEYEIKRPFDADNDGIDDITEYKSPDKRSVFNAATPIDFANGTTNINDRLVFKKLSYKGDKITSIDPHLRDLEFVKFYIFGDEINKAYLYFLNSETHKLHNTFKLATKVNTLPGFGLVANELKGEIIFYPNLRAPNGTLGLYKFEFEPNDTYPFEIVQMANELIAANMPFLNNNLVYMPMPKAVALYQKEKYVYDKSRVKVVLEEDINANIDYVALNKGTSFGILRKITSTDIPSFRDIGIYDNLPNDIPRLAGIISTVSQTPLSHINLRAMQDNTPNAYIKTATEKYSHLIGKYVKFEVKQETYLLTEATKEEFETFYITKRPTEPQTAKRDLIIRQIMPLQNITFKMAASFGSKTTNLAAMHTFDFKAGTIPNGFGIPFYYYHEFMLYNNLYDKIRDIINDSTFKNNAFNRREVLGKIRKDIENAKIPSWMHIDFSNLQAKFEKNSSIRCRSSTNNEDLQKFNGAGLYTSKTHRPTEGHLSKTIKEVFASVWNFEAIEEREYYKIDHFSVAMGVLCHNNTEKELVNGVAVSTDPIYYTNNSFYLNNQIGENLITNPEYNSLPEEIIIDVIPQTLDNYIIVQYSNFSKQKPLLHERHIDNLRNYLSKIHNNFKLLYQESTNDKFAIEIEYKITKDDKLLIKQARPWNGPNTSFSKDFIKDFHTEKHTLTLSFYPNPFQNIININFQLPFSGMVSISFTDILGKNLKEFNLGYFLAGSYTQELEPFITNYNGPILAHVILKNNYQSISKTYKIQKSSK